MLKSKNKILMLVIIFVLIVSSMTGCKSKSGNTSSSIDGEKMIRILNTEDPSTGDPQKLTDTYLIALNVFDCLVDAATVEEGKSEIVPRLAEKWDVSDDGLKYTFYLRKNVKFHNGEELKADDVLFSFDRMLDPKTQALNTDFLDMIAGAKERMEGKIDVVSGIKVIDDYTVEITLEKPFAPFIANLAAPPCSIFNRKATTEAGEEFGLVPEKTIGTGPFIFKEWKLNEQFVMVANCDYFRGAPKLDGIIVKIVPDAETIRIMFETDEIDVFDVDNARSQYEAFKNSDKWKDQIVSGSKAGTYYYCLNQSIKPLDDVRIRKAIQMGIDRKTILDKLYSGEGRLVHGIIPPGVLGFNSDLQEIPYDPTKAKELISEAGYPNGFEMELAMTTDSPSTLKINEAVQAMLGDIGIDIKITQMDSASYFGIRAQGELPSYYNVWMADYNDPDNFFYTFFSEKNTFARSFCYNNSEVHGKIEEVRAMTDQDERMKLYQELEKTIVHEDAAWIPLFSLNKIFIVQPRVKNLKVSWNGWGDMPYYNVEIVE
ncbi:ABC transporter substrate-binding protein [Tissierella praeacuta]|uniref:ABC transporter substrate-binding protein n=1 Tax=Tissierella praeacuta TaxID=43131 RepID=UPI0028AB8383|nr:ABC transporter substrate-binding protein [Tissierella praeacuta]